MVDLPYKKILGARIRALREERGLSQSQAARRVPLSQKQWSRLELGDVSSVDRALLIRMAEILESPLATGELNQWLHAFGYRPYVLPGLPLPPNHAEFLHQYVRNPAITIDWGRYLRCANRPIQQLYNFRVEALMGIRRNWLWQYFHPRGLIYPTYPRDSEARILNHLFWDWHPYSTEAWNLQLKEDLEAALGVRWSDLVNRYHIPTEPITGALSEVVTISGPRHDSPLIFQTRAVTIPARPDLLTIVYEPMNGAALLWCHTHVPNPGSPGA